MHLKFWKQICLSFALLLTMNSPAFGQSSTEAMFVLRDIKSWLPGIYDSEPQLFLENAFGVSESGPHPRVYLDIQEAIGIGLAEAVFLAEWHDGDKSSPVARRELLGFSVDEKRGAVRMKRFPISDLDFEAPAGIGAAKVSAILKQSTFGAEDPCPSLWFRGQSDVYAVPEISACSSDTLVSTNMTLGTEGLWQLKVVRVPGGKFAVDREDGIHTKLYRTNILECFINIVHEGLPTSVGLEGRSLINPILMHDRGDTFEFQTKEESPRTFILLARKAMWPSRSGRNFVPMFMLWLYRDQISPDSIEGSAWASADSKRVAFDARGVGARCKIAPDQ